MSLKTLPARLLASIHGLTLADIEQLAIAEHVVAIVREEIALLAVLPDVPATLDVATEELRALSRMIARRSADVDVSALEAALAVIAEIARPLRTTRPDPSRAVAQKSGLASQHSPGAGIQIRDLWREGEKHAHLVTMPPGARWPELDYHIPGPEEVYIIEGDLDDGPVRHTAGTFVHYPAGSSHTPATQTGCALFVFYPEG